MSLEAYEFVKRHSRQTDDYLLELDEYRRPSDNERRMVIHFRVDRWSLSSLKRIASDWKALRQVLTCDLYGSPMDDSPVWHKFVTSMGFEPLTQVRCNDGKLRPMYIHRIKSDGRLVPNNEQHQQQHQ